MTLSYDTSPGLLKVLRQVAWVRAGLIVLSIVLYLGIVPENGALPLLLLFAFERTWFTVLVHWERARTKLAKLFLPLAIVWLMIMPVAEIALALGSQNTTLLFIGAQTDALGMSSPLIWLVVPIVLAAWQYGQTGLRLVLTGIVFEHILLGGVLLGNGQLGMAFGLNTLGRIAMLTIVGYVVWWLVRAQRKEHAALEQANRQLAQRAATVEQLAESRERNRMARELHDILAHALTRLNLQLQAITALLETDPAEAKAQLHQAQTLTRTSANEVRRAIKQLRATPLVELGLAEAIRELCRGLAERTTAHVDYAIADLPVLDPLTEQAIYRIVFEALANVEHHAAATLVQVDLREQSHRTLCLSIRDNGTGFDQSDVAEGHFGLVGMFERAKEIGGVLRVESAEHRGTRIELEIPLGLD